MKTNSKVLIIGLVWPEPETTAAGSRMVQLIRLFSNSGMDVHFASTAAKTVNSVSPEDLGATSHSIQLNDPAFDPWIEKLGPDLVVFDRFVTEEQFSWRVRQHCSSAVRILDTEDLHFLREARRQALNQNKDDFKALLLNDIALRELASIYRSDLTLIISEYENELLQAHFGLDKSLLHYLPFLLQDGEIHDGKDSPSYSDRKDFMTMGNWKHGPNRDSVYYLKEQVWPALRRMMPDAKLHVYGAYGGESDLGLHDPTLGFFVEGWANSKKSTYFSHRVCLAPLRYGAGLKGKLLDSMRFGLPSVTTGIGAEGIAGDLPWNGFVADSPAQLAKAAVELYHDKALWNESRLNGWRIVKERFREELFEKELLNRLDLLVSGIQEHRTKNFTGALLWHHNAQSTKYLSKWIEAKNQYKQAVPRSPGQTE